MTKTQITKTNLTKTQITKTNLNLFKFTRKTCIRILLIVCLFLLLGKTVSAPTNFEEINVEAYKAKMYESATQQLIIEVDSYIKKYAEDSKLSASFLVDVCDAYDFDLKLVLAQGHLESHFGTKGKAAVTNSVFNVGTFDDGTILYTYKNPNQSVEPYVQLVKTRYLTDDKKEIELLEHRQFIDVKGKRYASSTTYEEQLLQIVTLISMTTPIDSLMEVRKKFMIKPPEEVVYLTQNMYDTSQREIQ